MTLLDQMAEAGKRPKDLTPDELMALPTGPFIEVREPVTVEDRARGVRGAFKVKTLAPKVLASWSLPDDIMFFRDIEGSAWSFGQWADGRWFKQGMSI